MTQASAVTALSVKVYLRASSAGPRNLRPLRRFGEVSFTKEPLRRREQVRPTADVAVDRAADRDNLRDNQDRVGVPVTCMSAYT
jgi:hypothetical protein